MIEPELMPADAVRILLKDAQPSRIARATGISPRAIIRMRDGESTLKSSYHRKVSDYLAHQLRAAGYMRKTEWEQAYKAAQLFEDA